MKEITHRSFFTGIGGFDYGAHAAGIKTISMCENDPWCIKQLKRQFPNVEIFPSLQETPTNIPATIFSGGFPCQDISISNPKGINAKGIRGERSGLFFQFAEVVRISRPEYLVLENSPALINRGLHEVLTTLTQIGYMCEWQCIRASDFGYNHKRERIVIIAYPMCRRRRDTIFKLLSTIGVHTKRTPGEATLRVSTSRANGYRDNQIVCRGDVVPGINGWLHAYGNSFMPVIAEYVFKCILKDIERMNQ